MKNAFTNLNPLSSCFMNEALKLYIKINVFTSCAYNWAKYSIAFPESFSIRSNKQAAYFKMSFAKAAQAIAAITGRVQNNAHRLAFNSH